MTANRSKQAPLFSAFISHAKADAKKAQAIAEGLEKRGFKCWIAPRDVKAGRSYGDEIIRGIESAKAFVLVLSKASNDSAFVAREVERAVSKKKPVLAIRIADVQPAPSLELFVSSTQWIDAFPGRLAPHIGRLADLIAEEEGAAPSVLGGEPPPQPRRLPKWAIPLGAAISVLLVLGAGFALWPPRQMSDEGRSRDASGFEKPIFFPKADTKPQEQMAAVEPSGDTKMIGGGKPGMESNGQMAAWGSSNDTEMIVGGNPVSPMAARDPDFRTCEKSSGDDAIAACDRAIASGKFTGQSLSYLYNDRGFMLMQKGAIEAAMVDLNKAIEVERGNFYAYWNRGAIYAAKGDLARAQQDLNTALALNPDEGSRAKIREALNAVVASASKSETNDPGVITTPTWGNPGQDNAAAASQGYAAEMPAYPADAMPASPPMATMPALPAAPAPMPAR